MVRTKTKVQTVTSVKLALSTLALGMSALAAAAASMPVIKKPDLTVASVNFSNTVTGAAFGDLTFVVRNIGKAPTPAGWRVFLQASNKSSFACGTAGLGCVIGSLLPQTVVPKSKPKVSTYVINVPSSFKLQPNSSLLITARVPLVDITASVPTKIDFKVIIDTSQKFVDGNAANNIRLLSVPGASLFKKAAYAPTQTCVVDYGYGTPAQTDCN